MTFDDVRVARKRHVPGTATGGCDRCRGPIEPGETYSRCSATPRDAEVNQSDQWRHLKVHHPRCPERP